VCIVLLVILLRGRKPKADATAKAPASIQLPLGLDASHVPEEAVDITRVTPFLPSLSGDDDDRDDDAIEDESKAMLHFANGSWMGVDEPTGPIALILTSAAGQTDRGTVRRRNEDALLVDPTLDLYVVADGMGGYAGGDVASRLAVEEVRGSIDSGAPV